MRSEEKLEWFPGSGDSPGQRVMCQAAEQVVVYCTGGECEDSDTAAILLRDAGVPTAKLFVYGGGFAE